MPDVRSIRELNLALATALGVEHPNQVRGITLVIRPGAAPELTVTRHLSEADGLREVIEQILFVPKVENLHDVTTLADAARAQIPAKRTSL